MPASPELQQALDRLGAAVTARSAGRDGFLRSHNTPAFVDRPTISITALDGRALRVGSEMTETFWRPGMRRCQTNIIRTEGDERICATCRRRWGLSEDRPDCERGCNGR